MSATTPIHAFAQDGFMLMISGTLIADKKPVELSLKEGAIGPSVVDISKLYDRTGMFPSDASFTSTVVTESKTSYIDGDKRILLSNGYPNDQLSERGDSVEKSEAHFRALANVVPTIVWTAVPDGAITFEEQQALLMRELHHRVKNTLTTVQALVNSTARNATSVQEFRDAVTRKIASLAKTHTLLFNNDMVGVQLREILRNELDPYDDQTGTRVILNGPDLDLPPDIALAVGMAAHELTTNAAKYGALSSPQGRVHVTWGFPAPDVKERRIRFEWTEQGGPPVAVPDHKGFGTQLLERVLSRQLGGEVDVAFAPEGLRVRVEASLVDLAR